MYYYKTLPLASVRNILIIIIVQYQYHFQLAANEGNDLAVRAQPRTHKV